MNYFIVPPDIERIRRDLRLIDTSPSETEKAPNQIEYNKVEQYVYDAYRNGLTVASADVVLLTKDSEGVWKILLSKRNTDKAFGGFWWVYGGAIPVRTHVIDFVKNRAKSESGILPEIKTLLAVAYTSDPGNTVSSIQPCYMGVVEYSQVIQTEGDIEHSDRKLFSYEEYNELPAQDRFWYVDEMVEVCFKVIENL